MKTFVIRLITALVLMVLSATTRALNAQTERPAMLISRQHSFLVPFSVAPTADPAQAPREVFLYVSTDRGVHWQLAGRTNPAARRFLVRTESDGEHWFLVRTLSQSGQLSPADVSKPGLRVLIDTANPETESSQTSAPQQTPAWPTSASSTPAADANSNSASDSHDVAGARSTAWPADQQSHVPLAPATTRHPSQLSRASASPAGQQNNSAADAGEMPGNGSVNRPLTVNKMSFELPYRPQPAGPGGLLKADLWGTSDAGRSWTYYGTDVDRQSPFHVTVPNTGLYGFLILLHTRGGTRPPDPKPGDLPNIWVLVQESDS